MSGGRFDYKQYEITTIADTIESIIIKNGTEKTNEELNAAFYYSVKEYLERYPEERFHSNYSEAVISEMKKAVDILKKAAVYAQRIDWFLSGDDSEESFLTRLEEDLNKLKNK